jgi:hypothetical protein
LKVTVNPEKSIWDLLGASTRRKRTTDATLGEAIGLNEALDMMINLQLSKVVFKLDTQLIVKVVKARKILRLN